MNVDFFFFFFADVLTRSIRDFWMHPDAIKKKQKLVCTIQFQWHLFRPITPNGVHTTLWTVLLDLFSSKG